jgi:Domain of unknown function (DUF4258)
MTLADDGLGRFAAAVRKAAREKLLFLHHAVTQMSRPDRMLTVEEVRSVLVHGEIIEDYPEDARGHSCLMLGTGDSGRAVHVVCAPKADYLAIITAYLPEEREWSKDFKTRRVA